MVGPFMHFQHVSYAPIHVCRPIARTHTRSTPPQAIGQKALSTAFAPPESVGITAADEVYVKRGYHKEIVGRRAPAATGDEGKAASDAPAPTPVSVSGPGDSEGESELAPADVCVAHPSFDVWSLAAVLYQMCTDNKPLFQGGQDDTLSADPYEEDKLFVLAEWLPEVRTR